jgi:hypothetical protein
MLTTEQREPLTNNEYDKEKYYTQLLKEQLSKLLDIKRWAVSKKHQFAGIDAVSSKYKNIDFKFDEYKGDFAFIELNSYNNPVNNGFAGNSVKQTDYVVWVKLETGKVYVVSINKIKDIAERCKKVDYKGRNAHAKGRDGGSNGILWNLNKLAVAERININLDDVVGLKNAPGNAYKDEDELIQKEAFLMWQKDFEQSQ